MESSSDDERPIRQRVRRLMYRRQRQFRLRCNFGLDDFQKRFRITPALAEMILNLIGPDLQHPTQRNYATTPKQQLLMALRVLATGDLLFSVGDAHGLSDSTVSRSLHAVVKAVNRRLFDKVICWPQTDNELREVRRKFFDLAQLPNVCGCVDGTHVDLRSPTEFPWQFVNRHGGKSLNCMAVCGPDYKFFYVSAKWPGSVHDARVLRNSTLATRFENGWRPFPDAIVLGDSGYPLLDWLIPPIRDYNNLLPAELRFNVAHRATRRVVECSFGVLKERFRCLSTKLHRTPEFCGEIFKCCAVMHNLCLVMFEDDDILKRLFDDPESFLNDDVEDADGQFVGEVAVGGQQRLAQIIARF